MRLIVPIWLLLITASVSFAEGPAPAPQNEPRLELRSLIDEALGNNPSVRAYDAAAKAAGHRVSQAEAPPDPMIMLGYQNMGVDRYTYGESPDAQWKYGVSQMFPYPGKLGAKGDMARFETEGAAQAAYETRLRLIERVSALYYDLFLAYKELDIINDKTVLLIRIEQSALARYSAGKAMQQEVLMAQREKYMLKERQEMLNQKIQTLNAMLLSALGREDMAQALARPAEPAVTEFGDSLQSLLDMHIDHSPMIKEKSRMVSAAEARLKMANLEYYPDLTISAEYAQRGSEFDDMWGITAQIGIPIFYRSKQDRAVMEARESLDKAGWELRESKLMLASFIRENFYMIKSGTELMKLYKDGFIPKGRQEFDSAMSGYATGGLDAAAVISSLKSLIDSEFSYWVQMIEREKAIARIRSISGDNIPSSHQADQESAEAKQ